MIRDHDLSALDEADLAIGEVAQRVGLRTSAIRYYEAAGLLPPPRRSSGQRRYDPTVIERIRLIRFAQEAGFTVAEIHTLFEGFEEQTPASARWKILATNKLEEVDALIAKAEQMKGLLAHVLECRCIKLEECARYCHAAE